MNLEAGKEEIKRNKVEEEMHLLRMLVEWDRLVRLMMMKEQCLQWEKTD
jgi:hypothetical protein